MLPHYLDDIEKKRKEKEIIPDDFLSDEEVKENQQFKPPKPKHNKRLLSNPKQEDNKDSENQKEVTIGIKQLNINDSHSIAHTNTEAQNEPPLIVIDDSPIIINEPTNPNDKPLEVYEPPSMSVDISAQFNNERPKTIENEPEEDEIKDLDDDTIIWFTIPDD